MTEANTLPLAGRHVLITRAPHQASELAKKLRGLGAETILVPTIEIVTPASFVALDEALRRIASFDIVAFTSANAVRAFGDRSGHLGLNARPRRIAVVGPATARAAEAIGLRTDIMPKIYTAEALAETLLPQARECRVLLVLAEDAPPTLEQTLREGGANVAVSAAYANRIPVGAQAAITALFSDDGPIPDAVTFTSASTAGHLVALLEAAQLRLPKSVVRISIGPVTSLALRRLGLDPHAEASEPTLDALVVALVAQLRR